MTQILMTLCIMVAVFGHGTECIETNSTIVQKDYMEVCNETYKIDKAYLTSLNETGSFPEESDKTPKCFIKCMTESLKIVNSDGAFDIERILEIFPFPANETSVDELRSIYTTCADERYERDPCERSYEFTKCSIERILD